MSFSWQGVVNQFEIEYDAFCVHDHEENIFFDYTGVNAEGSSAGGEVRSSWAHLLLLDAILAYTEHKHMAQSMTQSLFFKYHKILRKCIQKIKLDQKMTREVGLDDSLTVHIPLSWSSLSSLQQTLSLEDGTVSDIFEFLVSSPLLVEEGALVKAITDMVNNIPTYDPPPHRLVAPKTNGSVTTSSSSCGDTAATLNDEKSRPPIDFSTTFAFPSPDHSSPPSARSEAVSSVDELPGEHTPPACKKADKTIINWSDIVDKFSRKCDNFLALGHNKILSDIGEVSTTFNASAMVEWLDLLILDALLCLLLRVTTKKRNSNVFNQHRVFRECIHEIFFEGLGDLIPSSSLCARSKTRPQQLVDVSQVIISVTPPWDNIVNFCDHYSNLDISPDPTTLKRSGRKMFVKREQARGKAGQALCHCHIFRHISLESAIEKAVQHAYWGCDVPTFPSAHDSAVANNLLHFCRTILASVEPSADQPPNEVLDKNPIVEEDDEDDEEEEKEKARVGTQRHCFSLGTFCSNVVDLDRQETRGVGGHVEAMKVKKQRI